MKGTIVVTLNGRASGKRLIEWKRVIEDTFKPQRSERFRTPEYLFHYYLCDFESVDQFKALVIGTGGVIVRKADDRTPEHGFEHDLLGDYGEHVLEIPDEGDAWRLQAPPNTVKVEYGAVPRSLERLWRPRDDHTHVALIPNHDGHTGDVDFAIFHTGPSGEPEDASTPSTLDEAAEALIRLLPQDERRKLAGVPKEQLMWETYTMSMGIRNSWHLWDRNSPLMHQFPGKQPDDVSSLVIDAAWEKLQHDKD